MTTPLDALAERHGISLHFHEIDGTYHGVSDDTKRALLTAFDVPASTEAEVARSLATAPEAREIAMRAPAGRRCFMPADLADRRVWGVALQVYQLRSVRNWGIGDFADLAEAARMAAAAGADFVGTNPLHALFPAEPERASPFFPSNRRFLNPLYIAVDKLPGFDPAMVDADRLESARSGEMVDYEAVSGLKYEVLHKVWTTWCEMATLPPEWSREAFSRWRAEQGEPLRLHALHDALSLALRDELIAGATGWRAWPEDYRRPDNATVETFARQHGADIEFHAWLQFAADRQLADAAEACRDAGMRVGLYLDLAVGEAPDGSATWADPHLVVTGAEIGAPPDYFTRDGQNWGLAGLSPTALAERAFTPYRDLMAAVMRHAGAVRIDHAMGVWQLFFIPLGRPAAEGTYVRFPIEDMLSAIAEESNAFRTIVVGEDLGNVPEGFRDVMDAAGLQSYRILYFERHEHGFRQPREYPKNALACLSTHDLPTIEGWWRGADVDLRLKYRLIDEGSAAAQRQARRHERQQLAGDLHRSGLIDRAAADRVLAMDMHDPAPLPESFVVAVHRHLARTTSRLATVRLEDLAGERQPVNLPGTVLEYPNWRRRLGVDLETLAAGGLFSSVTAAMCSERPKEG